MLRVLTYHRVAEVSDRPWLHPALISATPEIFQRQMQFLRCHYQILALDDVLAAVDGKFVLPDRAVLVTFDDGYRDFREKAWPILKELRLPAVLFVPTAFPDESNRAFWWDRLHHAVMSPGRPARRNSLLDLPSNASESQRLVALKRLQDYLKVQTYDKAMQLVNDIIRGLEPGPMPSSGVLGWDDLRSMAAEGLAVAAHTRTHPFLSSLTCEQILDELRGSQADLSRELGHVRPVFCFPNGDHDESVLAILRQEGFRAAFTTLDGHNDLRTQDPLRLHRTDITRRTTVRILQLRLTQWGGFFDAVRHGTRLRGRVPVSGTLGWGSET